jgi:hypothetical protein
VARKHRIAAALAGLSLALAPAAAHAQNGAGDQQYQDPFGSGSQTAPKAQQPSAPLSQAPPATSAPATPAPQAAQAASAAPVAQAQLPRTGLDVRVVAAAGLVLLLAGVALRLGLAHGRR